VLTVSLGGEVDNAASGTIPELALVKTVCRIGIGVLPNQAQSGRGPSQGKTGKGARNGRSRNPVRG